MNITEIKAAIAKGLTVACGDSNHIESKQRKSK